MFLGVTMKAEPRGTAHVITNWVKFYNTDLI